ncbi:MAG: WD40 repeat domain-containing protein, partial [Planctomycetaceae bacterium]
MQKALDRMKERVTQNGAGNAAGQPGGANPGNPVAGQPAGAGQPPMPGKRNGFEPPAQVAGAAAPADWRVKPDPLPGTEAEGESKPGSLNLPVGDTRAIVFPEGSSRFAALGGGRFNEMAWEVREIATGRKVGTVSEAKLRCDHWALSPDGKYLAGSQNSPQQVIVWEVKTGKRLGQLPQEGNFIRELLFAGPQKLLVVSLQGAVKVFELPSGRETRTVGGTERGGGVDRERMGVSPGGKYFVTAQRSSFDHCTLEVTDLETGELAGRTRLVEMRPGESSRVITDFNVKSISFSPDATQLAVAFDSSRNVGVAVVDVATGQQLDGFVCEHVVWQQGLSRREVTPLLEWFPNKQRWLYQGLGLIDRVAGKMVWTMPDADVDIPHGMPQARRVFDNQTVLVAGAQGNAVVLKPYEVPLDEVAKSAQVVAAGGMAVDAKLPRPRHRAWGRCPARSPSAGGAWHRPPYPRRRPPGPTWRLRRGEPRRASAPR